MACHYTVTIQRRDTFYSYIISSDILFILEPDHYAGWEETGFCGELWEGSSSQKTTVDNFGGEVTLVLSAQNKVVGVQGGGADTGLLKRPMQENNGYKHAYIYPGKRRGNLSKPPTAPKGNIRVSEDNCAFEVRV
ncbi:hypothetical protein DPMN_084968 [Dreissena polymorpha]|uniref:Uncharacterized protein n=1 Tax=Dreissena polymorpha TaxID=45954 RepID=A0A9D3YET4_DREPO|nr:hypothetical protein DPMN_084968 [Dreissena polymorpha]